MPSEEVRSLSSRLPITDPHFYDRGGPHAACGVRLRALVVDEFDVDAQEACPRCAELVAAGKAYRYPSEPSDPTFCSGFVRVKRGQMVSLVECSLRYGHDRPHEARTGETWPRRADGAAVIADD